MNAANVAGIAPEAVLLLEALPLSIVVVRADGAVAYANASAQRLAAVVHDDPELGLVRLTAAPPACTHADQCHDDGCEDSLACEGQGSAPLLVVRQWRWCGTSGLRSVTIRPAHTGEQPTPARGSASADAPSRDMLRTDKLATVGQLAAGMAHEINNPICYVQSNLGSFRDYTNKLFGLLDLEDHLLHDPQLGGDERRRLLDARKQAIDYANIRQDLPALLEESSEGVERIRHIVQSLRDFSRNNPDEPFQLYDVSRALDSAVDIVRNLGGRSHNCSTDYAPVPLIECSPTELNQLFMNILVNASQAIDAGGHIEVRLRPTDAAHIQVVISDDGCGMDEHVLSHVFEPFFTTKPAGTGTGLGMPISYGIVKKHRGEITVKSTPGHGTTFTITLPVKRPSDH